MKFVHDYFTGSRIRLVMHKPGVWNLVRCVVAFGGSSYFSLGIIAIGLVGTANRELSDIAISNAWVAFLIGGIIAIVPKPLVWPVALSAAPGPFYVQLLLIQSAIESSGVNDFLWLSLPVWIYVCFVGPILIRVVIRSGITKWRVLENNGK